MVKIMKAFLEPLEKEEEQYYIKKVKLGDVEARNILIERNMRLVAHIAKKYQNPEDDMEDLISIGTFGLIKGIITFDEKKGSKLATYSARCIENELLMHMRAKKKSAKDISLYEQIGMDKEGNFLQLVDVIESGQKELGHDVEVKETYQLIRERMKEILTDRELWIITRRYGMDGEDVMTQLEVSKELNISRSYVSRMEKKALEKLRRFLEQGKEFRIL